MSSDPVSRSARRWHKARLAALLLVGAGLASWLVDRMVIKAILQPARRGTDAILPIGMEERSFTLSDHVLMRAWMAKPAGKPAAVVFVLHGICDSKATQAGTLASLAERGIVGIAPDLRAHGQSGGDIATYGYLEKRDLSELRKEVGKEFPGIPIGLWGTSYGGAVALQAMGIDPEFSFAIIENTFADLRDVARQQVLHRVKLPFAAIGPYFVNRAGEAGGFNPGEVSPEASMEHISAPVLHLHGDKDEVIPFEHGERIARHARTKSYRFVRIKEGTHYYLSTGDPATYSREIAGFLDQVAPLK